MPLIACKEELSIKLMDVLRKTKNQSSVKDITWNIVSAWNEVCHDFGIDPYEFNDEQLNNITNQAIKLESNTVFWEAIEPLLKPQQCELNKERKWLSDFIFHTNKSVSYHKRAWDDMADNDTVRVRPFIRYINSDLCNNKSHKEWNNVILSWDDPWWDTHLPPNGWMCGCGFVSVSKRNIDKLRENKETIILKAPRIEYYECFDKRTGKTVKTPNGIDPGWDFNISKVWDI